MEQQKLPNVTTGLVLSIVSFFCCCLSSGIGGIIMSGIAFFLLKKDEKTYLENPEDYSNYSQLKTAKVIAIIGLVIAALTIAFVVFMIVQAGGWEAYMEEQKEVYREMGIDI